MREFDRNLPANVPGNGLRISEKKRGAALTFQEYQELKSSVHRDLITKVDLEKVANARDSRIRSQVFTVVQDLVENLNSPMSAAEKDRLSREVLDEVFGLGPLEPLLQDPGVNDILVNGPKNVFVERNGILERTPTMFRDNSHLMHIIERIVSAVGRHVDESSPMVDARLADGSRVNVIIPPLAIDGPQLSIRRFGHSTITEHDLLSKQTLTTGMLELLRGAVRARLNIVISGGTGAGKTTLLNILSGHISDKERIVSIEDSAELQLHQSHVVRLECRPANVEGRGAIMQRQLLINSLRMRPDRIILGEVRGEEALDMMQAMNTGHDGSLTTVHANTPRDAISRLEVMVTLANGNLHLGAIRQQIASAVNILVQCSRLSDGTRRVTSLTEVTGMEGEIVTLQDIFVFEKLGLTPDGRVRGRFCATGILPKFNEKLLAAGLRLPAEIFDEILDVGGQ